MYKSANRNAQRHVGGYGNWSRYSVGSSSPNKKIKQKRKPGQSARQLKVEQIENSPYFIAMREGRVKE